MKLKRHSSVIPSDNTLLEKALSVFPFLDQSTAKQKDKFSKQSQLLKLPAGQLI